MRLLISAGEASGEMYGAQLLSTLRTRRTGLAAFGVGGQRMRQAGCEIVVDSAEVAVVGLVEVVKHLPRIYARYRRLLRAVDNSRPDAAVLIDFPDFNFRLARDLARRGIPVIYYVSPQLWAWRPGRIELVRRYVRKMLVIFPFEQQWYHERGIEAQFVGHPLCDLYPLSVSSAGDPAKASEANPVSIALLPGSRRGEVEMNFPVMAQAAQILAAQYQDSIEFRLPIAPTLDRQWLTQFVAANTHLPMSVVDDARPALASARAAMVASGTATVEAALMGTPFVMVYRVSPLSWALGRHLVKVPHFAMVNLIAGREVVPELVQSAFTPENVAMHLKQILADGAARQTMLAGLAEVRSKLCPFTAAGKASENAAEAVLEAIPLLPAQQLIGVKGVKL